MTQAQAPARIQDPWGARTPYRPGQPWPVRIDSQLALRLRDVLDLVSECHPRTLRQLRWANTMIKDSSPQILSSL